VTTAVYTDLFRANPFDGVPLTVAAGHARKVERDLHAADMAPVMDMPECMVSLSNHSASSCVRVMRLAH